MANPQRTSMPPMSPEGLLSFRLAEYQTYNFRLNLSQNFEYMLFISHHTLHFTWAPLTAGSLHRVRASCRIIRYLFSKSHQHSSGPTEKQKFTNSLSVIGMKMTGRSSQQLEVVSTYESTNHPPVILMNCCMFCLQVRCNLCHQSMQQCQLEHHEVRMECGTFSLLG